MSNTLLSNTFSNAIILYIKVLPIFNSFPNIFLQILIKGSYILSVMGVINLKYIKNPKISPIIIKALTLPSSKAKL